MRTNGNGGKNYTVVFIVGFSLLVCLLRMSSFGWLVLLTTYPPHFSQVCLSTSHILEVYRHYGGIVG